MDVATSTTAAIQKKEISVSRIPNRIANDPHRDAPTRGYCLAAILYGANIGRVGAKPGSISTKSFARASPRYAPPKQQWRGGPISALHVPNGEPRHGTLRRHSLHL